MEREENSSQQTKYCSNWYVYKYIKPQEFMYLPLKIIHLKITASLSFKCMYFSRLVKLSIITLLQCQHSSLCSKRDIKESTFVLHESHCKRHITLCEICEEPISIREKDEHFQENHAPVACTICGQLVPKDTLDDHKVNKNRHSLFL